MKILLYLQEFELDHYFPDGELCQLSLFRLQICVSFNVHWEYKRFGSSSVMVLKQIFTTGCKQPEKLT